MIRQYPSLFVLLFVVTGIALANASQIAAGDLVLGSLALALAGLWGMYRRWHLVTAISLAGSLGLAAACHFALSVYDLGPNHVSQVANERTVYHIYGRVADWPDLKPNRTELKITLDSLVDTNSHTVRGAVLLKITDTTTALQRGDRIEFFGRIYTLHESGDNSRFSYRRFMALKGVFGIVYLPTLLDVRIDHRSSYGVVSSIDRLRNSIRDALYADLSPAAAALASGFLIGETRDIPASVYARFRDSGTLHLLAVSGSNVALVLLVMAWLFRPLGLSRTGRAILLLVITALFAGLSYGEPSVIRASVMAGLVIIAGLLNRRYDLNNLIALTALIVLLVDPAQMFDVGFQLSFVTAWGLVFIVAKFTGFFEHYQSKRWYIWLVFPLIVSLVAQVVSSPLIVYYFGRVPLLSLPANLIIVPLVSMSVIGVLILLIAHLILPPLGLMVGSLVDVLMRFLLWTLELFGGDNMPVIDVGRLASRNVELAAVLAAYAFLLLLTWAIRNRPFRRIAIFAAMLTANIGLVYAVSVGGEAERKIMCFSIPGGVASVVPTGEKGTADLIITGASAKEYSIGERVIAPVLGDKGIDRIRYLFIMACEYDAVADLLRMADSLHAQKLLAASSLRPSISDVRAHNMDPPLGGLHIAYFGAGHPAGSGDGYRAAERAIELACDDAVLIFVKTFPAANSLELVGSNSALIVGSNWYPTADDWLAARRRGLARIVCSRIEPRQPQEHSPGELRVDRELPDYLWDLSRNGPYLHSLKAVRADFP
ncbi:MAG: ComEC/Rec2 family competence protein [Candidatus Zixiibacteriota bacterium]